MTVAVMKRKRIGIKLVEYDRRVLVDDAVEAPELRSSKVSHRDVLLVVVLFLP